MIWDQLVKIALLGTERSTLPTKLEKELAERGIATQQEATKVLLDALAYYSTIEKAGWQPQKWKGKSLTKSKAHKEEQCSSKSAKQLQTILKIYPKLIPEFASLLKTSKKCLPYEALPNLLNRCVKDDTLWAQLQPVLGDRGRWLIPLNPEWKTLTESTDENLWQTGNKKERLSLLQKVRQQNSQQGLRLLQSTWDTDSAAEKASLLNCLQIELSKEDEKFLESCLEASRKEIRQTAVKLLIQIPNSALLQRVQSYLEALISFNKKKDTVLFTLPDLSNKAFERDGLAKKKHKNTTAEKLQVLANMIRITPPSFWENHLADSPAQIIKLFAQGEPSLTLVNALVESTAIHPSKEWTSIFLEVWVNHYFEIGWDALKMKPILNSLPNELYINFLTKKLKAVKLLPEEDSPLMQLLSLEGQVWSKQLTFLFLEQLGEWIRQNATLSWLGQTYRKILKERAGYAIDPMLHPQITAFWRVEQNNWAGWSQDIQRFLNILSFRKAMTVELTADLSQNQITAKP